MSSYKVRHRNDEHRKVVVPCSANAGMKARRLNHVRSFLVTVASTVPERALYIIAAFENHYMEDTICLGMYLVSCLAETEHSKRLHRWRSKRVFHSSPRAGIVALTNSLVVY